MATGALLLEDYHVSLPEKVGSYLCASGSHNGGSANVLVLLYSYPFPTTGRWD